MLEDGIRKYDSQCDLGGLRRLLLICSDVFDIESVVAELLRSLSSNILISC